MSTKTKLHAISFILFFFAMMIAAFADALWLAAANCVAFVFQLALGVISLDRDLFGDRCDCGRDCDHDLRI